MRSADTPENEKDRLQALIDYAVLDTDPEPTFDSLTQLASDICGMPIALVSLIDGSRQWFKSHHGIDATETPREYAFCAHAILDECVFEIIDSRQDDRFFDNPLVTDEPHVIAYVGMPLTTPDGYNIGTLCVIDNEPHKLSEQQKRHLRIIADQVIVQLELDKKNREQKEVLKLQQDLLQENKEQSHLLELKNKELEVYDYVVAHDLRAPLRGIRFYAESTIEDVSNGDDIDVLEGYRNICKLTQKADHLIKKLLEYSVAGDLDGEFCELDVAQCVDDVIQLLHAQFVENDAAAEVDLVNVTINAIPVKFRQLMQNLITNAIKYQRDDCDPILKIYSQQQADALELVIEDNGIGIDPDMREKIFAPFCRLHDSSSRYAGSGIGLSVCSKIADLHGWSIRAEGSEAGGSRFVISVPATKI